MDKIDQILMCEEALPHYESLEAKLEAAYQNFKNGEFTEAFSFFDEMEKRYVKKYGES